MKRKSASPVYQLSADKKNQLLNALTASAGQLKLKLVTAGFDGFVDTIIKIIKKKKPDKAPNFFTTIKELGLYILEKEGTSFSFEVEEQNMKLGGNMPIMANALGQLDIPVNCIGGVGYPEIHTVFKNFSTHCQLYSFANPGTSTAYEFTDGKIMMAQMGELNGAGWEKIKERIGLETLIALYKNSDLICLLNWSEIDASTDIWKGIVKDILPACRESNSQQLSFFDLSDCSKRSMDAIQEMLELLQEFSSFKNVILSLNRNESGIIYRALYNKDPKKDLSFTGKKIMEKLNIDTLVLHSAAESLGFRRNEFVSAPSFFTDKPTISTGAGDNFNAGFCTGQLLDLDLELSIILANAVSGCYVRKGLSPQIKDIIDFLENISASD